MSDKRAEWQGRMAAPVERSANVPLEVVLPNGLRVQVPAGASASWSTKAAKIDQLTRDILRLRLRLRRVQFAARSEKLDCKPLEILGLREVVWVIFGHFRVAACKSVS